MNTHVDYQRDEALAEEAITWFARMRAEIVTDEERAGFAAWIDASPVHRKAYDEVHAFWDDPVFTRALSATPLTTVVGHRPRARRHQHVAWGLAITAGFALAVVIGRPAWWHCLQADECTGFGEVKTVDLADGSRVILNTDSALRIDLEDGSRHVRLIHGEAFFDVRRDPQHPFVVDGRYSRTCVKGTRFTVREEQDADTVTVVSGVVEVRKAGQRPVLLRDNDQLRVDEGTVGDVRRVTSSAAAAWTRGGALFDGATLEQVVGELARYRLGTVILANERVKSLKVSGRLDIRDTDKSLESLRQTLPIRIRRITPWLVVIS